MFFVDFFLLFLVLPAYWLYNNVSVWVMPISVLILLTEFLRRQKEYVRFSSVNKHSKVLEVCVYLHVGPVLTVT